MNGETETSGRGRRPPVRNPHLWITVVVSVVLLLIYQAWPWREWQFADGVWQYFPWLSALNVVVRRVEVPYELYGCLFLIPIIYGSLLASWPAGVIAWLVSLAWVFPTLIGWSARTLAVDVALLLLPALLVALASLERQWRRREREHYAEREHERQSFVSRLVEAQEMERRRIALEIHDGIIQTLMVIANRAESVASSQDLAASREGSTWIKAETLGTIDDLRRLSMNLRPSILDNFGLVSGIEWLVNASNTQSDCQIDVQVKGDERELGDLTKVNVFRVVQEAIQNIHRHARASAGSIFLEFDDVCLRLRVQDNGVGFSLPDRLSTYAAENKLGILGIEQRIASLGGTMQLDSHPGRGTTLSAVIPYQPTVASRLLKMRPSKEGRR